MSKTKVAILGMGASAIFAAKAAKDLGCEVKVYTNKTKIEFLPGSFWLHWIPEDLQQQITPTPIYHMGKGIASNYQTLQWGRIPVGIKLTDFPKKDEYSYGYNPAEVLPLMLPEDITVLSHYMSEKEIEMLAKNYDFVLQTFPTDTAKQTQIPMLSYIVASKIGSENPEINCVIYNGMDENIIVRDITLWSSKFLEFPKYLPIVEIQRVMLLPGFTFKKLWELSPFTKPWRQPSEAPKNLHLVGRWAEWNRNRLSCDAYKIVQQVLQNA